MWFFKMNKLLNIFNYKSNESDNIFNMSLQEIEESMVERNTIHHCKLEPIYLNIDDMPFLNLDENCSEKGSIMSDIFEHGNTDNESGISFERICKNN